MYVSEAIRSKQFVKGCYVRSIDDNTLVCFSDSVRYIDDST